MEYILISESKLKITLESEDLRGLECPVAELDYADPEAKRLLGDILGYAKDELGFDTAGHRVLMQLFPSKDGGCEIFVTRLGRLSEGEGESAENAHGVPSQKRERPRGKRRRAFRFERLSYLVDACKRLCELCPTPSADVYVNSEKEWFLILTLSESDYAEALDMLPVNELSFLCEYGTPEDARALSLYLGEYGVPVCRTNAAELLSRL